ncbi:MAG TPA: hypothetical protein DDZ89_15035 [Clostridiales bacterium]|nr:hypothetical protein [Clostridiales bacterium]
MLFISWNNCKRYDGNYMIAMPLYRDETVYRTTVFQIAGTKRKNLPVYSKSDIIIIHYKTG